MIACERVRGRLLCESEVYEVRSHLRDLHIYLILTLYILYQPVNLIEPNVYVVPRQICRCPKVI